MTTPRGDLLYVEALASNQSALATLAQDDDEPTPNVDKQRYIIKRDGRKEAIKVEKITKRINNLCYDLDLNFVDPFAVALQVIGGIYYGMKTSELDRFAAEIAGNSITVHPDYSTLAARIFASNLHKETPNTFSEAIKELYLLYDPVTQKHCPIIAPECYAIVMKNADALNNAVVAKRDYEYTYFGLKTLERAYLLRANGRIIERPQYMLMRVAVGIHKDDINKAIETYEYMSQRYFTHATPTLFTAGTVKPQLSSCFLLSMKSDSIEGIFNTLTQTALISKAAGGIGMNIHCIRAKGSPISSMGESAGIVPMLRVFNNVARYVDQGGGKRPGAFAIYLEPWHADIRAFLDLRKNTGKDENRARELFYGLWIPDLFMKRVFDDGDWSLMCPHMCPGLDDVWGDEFDALYTRYEQEKRAKEVIKARDLWLAITEAQTETGTPFLLYKDACNRKSNQQNLGTIKCSNLCTEIVQFSSPDEVAVCNLASIALNRFVRLDKTYDFNGLYNITKIITRNLNKVIDVTSYPVPEAQYSNLKHRPLGIGVQGLADAFILMRFPFDSDDARNLNIQIFETIYFAALEASCELAEVQGTYESYPGSPVSRNILQFDMWNVVPTNLWPWDRLRKRIAQFGVRNSLLVAPMPTASTAQILGNTESIEPYTSNIYCRRVLAGEYQIVNQHLVYDLIERNLWSENVKNLIIANRGSIQHIFQIPDDLKKLYKTAWELSPRTLIRYAADRGAFIDQSQSLNLYVPSPNFKLMSSIHFYAFKLGLKTGMYYLRSLPAANAVQFTVPNQTEKQIHTTLQTTSHTTSHMTPHTAQLQQLQQQQSHQQQQQQQQRVVVPTRCTTATIPNLGAIASKPTCPRRLDSNIPTGSDADLDVCLSCGS